MFALNETYQKNLIYFLLNELTFSGINVLGIITKLAERFCLREEWRLFWLSRQRNVLCKCLVKRWTWWQSLPHKHSFKCSFTYTLDRKKNSNKIIQKKTFFYQSIHSTWIAKDKGRLESYSAMTSKIKKSGFAKRSEYVTWRRKQMFTRDDRLFFYYFVRSFCLHSNQNLRMKKCVSRTRTSYKNKRQRTSQPLHSMLNGWHRWHSIEFHDNLAMISSVDKWHLRS